MCYFYNQMDCLLLSAFYVLYDLKMVGLKCIDCGQWTPVAGNNFTDQPSIIAPASSLPVMGTKLHATDSVSLGACLHAVEAQKHWFQRFLMQVDVIDNLASMCQYHDAPY